MKHLDKRQVAGWIAVGFSTFITSIWAFWGIIENHHEGWYYESWLSNVTGCTTKRLCPATITTIFMDNERKPADDKVFRLEVEKIGLECTIMKYGDEIV